MNSQSWRILICDDHDLIREGLKRMVVDGGVVCTFGEARDAAETMAAVRQPGWDVVILDINLGTSSGMDILKNIRSQFPKLPVLVLSIHAEEEFALRVLRAGANGYLNKNVGPKELVAAIRKVQGGGHYITPKVAEQLLTLALRPQGQPLHTTLSDREDQVMRLLAAGRTVGEIALEKKLSVKTISTYRAITLRKLGLRNNAQLMRYAQDQALLT